MQIYSMTDGLIEVDEAALGNADVAPGPAPDAMAMDLIGGESRRIFFNQGYPWSLIGKIYTEKNGGEGSGILIGKNLVLTAFHCVSRGGLRQSFAPAAYFDPPPGKQQFPYGDIPISNAYYWQELANPGGNEYGSVDYAVLKLEREPMIGWAGVYGSVDSGWINRKMWYHIGYPVNNVYGLKDHKNGRPCFEMDIAIGEKRDFTYTHPTGKTLDGSKFFTNADTEGGQSGGPLFNIVDNVVMVSGVLSQSGSTDSGFAACHPNLAKLVAWCRQNA